MEPMMEPLQEYAGQLQKELQSLKGFFEKLK
jgi:hypothetical protein